jgi:integrase
MPAAKLSKSYIAKLDLPSKDGTRHTQLEVYDTEVRGLTLRITSGGSRKWDFNSRFDGKRVRIPIGDYTDVTVEEAREKAIEYRRMIREGINPRHEIDRIKADRMDVNETTFGRIAERFLKLYPEEAQLRARSIEEYRRSLLGKDTARWRNHPIASITKADVSTLVDELMEAGHRQKAIAVAGYLKKLFDWCEDRDLVQSNPAARARPKKAKRKPKETLTLDELAAIWLAADGLGSIQAAYVRTLILTGARRKETAMMKLADLRAVTITDDDRIEILPKVTFDDPLLAGAVRAWIIPADDVKTGREHVVFVSDALEAVLRSVPRTGGSYVFSSDGETYLQGYSKVKAKLDELTEGVPDHTFHDYRKAFTTIANSRRLATGDVIELACNRVSFRSGVRSIYDKSEHFEARRELAQKWGELVWTADT